MPVVIEITIHMFSLPSKEMQDIHFKKNACVARWREAPARSELYRKENSNQLHIDLTDFFAFS